MIRISLLKAGALLGLALCALIVWQARTPVETPPKDTNSATAMLTPAQQRPRSERISGTTLGRELAPDTSHLGAELEQFISEVETDTNALQFEERAARMQDFVDTISTNDLPAMFNELCERQKSNPTTAGRDLELRLLQRWSAFDVRAAAQALNQLPSEDRSEPYKIVAAAWAKQNLSEAITWAQQLQVDSTRQDALLSIASEAALSNPKEALMLASQMTVPPEKSDMINQAASTWATESPETAATWANQIQDKPLREQVLAAIATSWADQDPNAAAQLVLNSVTPGSAQDNAIMGIVQRMAMKDMEAAKAWVAQFSEGPMHDRAASELTRIEERQQLVQPKL